MTQLLKSKEAAKRLCISERTLWTLMNEGKIPAIKMNRCIRYDPKDLDAFIESARINAGK